MIPIIELGPPRGLGGVSLPNRHLTCVSEIDRSVELWVGPLR